MAVHETTSLSGISSNRVRASLVNPVSKYDLRIFVAKIDGTFGKKGELEWALQFWTECRECRTIGGIGWN